MAELRWPVALPPSENRPLVVLGAKYRVRYRVGRQKLDRESVLIFVGINVNRGKATSIWSARPLAGTQQIPVEQVSDLAVVDYGTQIYLNRVVK